MTIDEFMLLVPGTYIKYEHPNEVFVCRVDCKELVGQDCTMIYYIKGAAAAAWTPGRRIYIAQGSHDSITVVEE